MKGKFMAFFKLGKARVPHKKNTAELPAVPIKPPARVRLPMAQHIGAPAKPVVRAGDEVFVGTLIGEASGPVSANIHSTVSGKVAKIEQFLMSNGRMCELIAIDSDGNMTPDPSIKPPKTESFEDLSRAARDAGIVGLGGAGFPTSVKLDPRRASELDTLLINAAECEPFITSDTRTMLDETELIYEGVRLILDLSAIPRAIIGIEENKAECIAKLTERFSDDPRVTVHSLPSLYPQGGEKILIYNTTERTVPEGALPADVGVLIMNVTTVAELMRYVKTGMPLVSKVITVDGSAVSEPKNLRAPIGTPISDILDAVGVHHENAGKILYGGPMMGVAVYSLDSPVQKNTNAITVFDKNDASLKPSTPCIHCGRCVSICPMSLNPTVFAKALNLDDSEERGARLEDGKVNLCIECGCCSYVCPAKRPLVENNRAGKAELRIYQDKKKKKNEGGNA